MVAVKEEQKQFSMNSEPCLNHRFVTLCTEVMEQEGLVVKKTLPLEKYCIYPNLNQIRMTIYSVDSKYLPKTPQGTLTKALDVTVVGKDDDIEDDDVEVDGATFEFNLT